MNIPLAVLSQRRSVIISMLRAQLSLKAALRRYELDESCLSHEMSNSNASRSSSKFSGFRDFCRAAAPQRRNADLDRISLRL